MWLQELLLGVGGRVCVFFCFFPRDEFDLTFIYLYISTHSHNLCIIGF